MNVNFSEMTQAKLRRCGADNVGIAMGIQISHHDVTPLECSSHKFYFRIGQMYFDLIVNGTTSLYATDENNDVSIHIASFRSDGSIIGR